MSDLHVSFEIGSISPKGKNTIQSEGKKLYILYTYLSAALDFIRRKKILTIYICNPIYYFVCSHAFTQFEFLTIGMFKVKYCLCFILRSPYVKIGSSKKINIAKVVCNTNLADIPFR